MPPTATRPLGGSLVVHPIRAVSARHSTKQANQPEVLLTTIRIAAIDMTLKADLSSVCDGWSMWSLSGAALSLQICYIEGRTTIVRLVLALLAMDIMDTCDMNAVRQTSGKPATFSSTSACILLEHTAAILQAQLMELPSHSRSAHLSVDCVSDSAGKH